MRAGVVALLVGAVAAGTLLLVPGQAGPTEMAAKPAAQPGAQPTAQPAVLAHPVPVTTTAQASQPFGGTAAVGALFTLSSGSLGTHFCTASVVHSAHGDLAVTAAHCVTGTPGQIVFVPGYASGQAPYGVWPVTAVYTSPGWQSSQDPDDDVAFLRLSGADGVPIEEVTGAEQLDTSHQQPALVRAIGYPDDTEQPVMCTNWSRPFSPTQLEFDCDGFPDGTSGGPFLADVSAAGHGTVIGVIGGYQRGGDTSQVSYASTFGTMVTGLYQSAQAGG